MKKTLPLISFWLLISLSLISLPFWLARLPVNHYQSLSPKVYQTFPSLSIYARKLGAFSSGYQPTGQRPIVDRPVLGFRDLPTASISYQFTVKRVSPLSQANNQQKLNNWLADQPGSWGVVVYDLRQKEKFAFNDQQKFHAASVMKLATAVSVFDWMAENQQSLATIVQGQSLRSRLTQLINQSNNHQWAVLGNLVGLERTQTILQENGLHNSNIYTNTMTAEDVFLLLNQLHSQQLLDQSHQQFLLTTMQKTINEKRIPAKIPAQTAVAHKYGTWQTNIHDAGLVYSQQPYIIVVMTNQVPQAEEKIAEFSSQVYQLFSQTVD